MTISLSSLTSSMRKPSLMVLTAGVAGAAIIANVVVAAAPPGQPQPTRLGTSIQQSVRERDQALAKQKRGLELREQAARATEERLKADLAARQGQQNRGGANTDANAGPQAANEPYDELARIYQTMKPARAAPIFERLDLDVQTEVAKRMRERATALILSNMSPNAAVQLSMALAGRQVAKPQARTSPPTQQPRTPTPRPQAAGAKPAIATPAKVVR